MEALIQQYPWLDELLMGFLGLTWKHVVMWGVGALLIYLAAAKDYEPALLLPIGFGAVLANIPHSSAVSQVKGEEGFLIVLYNAGISNELFPVLIFAELNNTISFAFPAFVNGSRDSIRFRKKLMNLFSNLFKFFFVESCKLFQNHIDTTQRSFNTGLIAIVKNGDIVGEAAD